MTQLLTTAETAPTRKPTAAKVEKLLYTINDAAYALSISRRALEYMLADKRIAFRRMGSRRMIPATELRRIARQDNL